MTCHSKFQKVNLAKMTHFPGAGCRYLFSENIIDGLKSFYSEQGELTNSVSVIQWHIHARSISEEEVDAILSTNFLRPNHAIKQRIYLLLSKWDQSWRRGTHRAQNKRYDISIQNDFTPYVNQKIKRLGIPKENVLNVDETNIPFVMEQRITWGQKADDTNAIRKADTTNRMSCLLGTNITGTLKLPPHCVFKGTKGRVNRVMREVNEGIGYTDQCTYTVKKRVVRRRDFP
jgi:hypothetical protein